MKKLLECAKKGTLFLQEGQITEPGQTEPGTIEEQRAAAIAEYMSDDTPYRDAWRKAADNPKTQHLFTRQLQA